MENGKTIQRGGNYKYAEENRKMKVSRYLSMRIDRLTSKEDEQLIKWSWEAAFSSAYEGVLLSDLEWTPDWQAVHGLFQQYQFKSLLTKVQDMSGEVLDTSTSVPILDTVSVYSPTSLQIISESVFLLALILSLFPRSNKIKFESPVLPLLFSPIFKSPFKI